MSDRKLKIFLTYLGIVFLAVFSGGSLQAGNVPSVEGVKAPVLLDEKALLNVSELALSLSARRDWLHPAILDELSHRTLRLDEIFVDAPSTLLIEGRPYRLMIGLLGRRQEVDTDESFSVFLTADVHMLAKGQLLGFQNGEQVLLWPDDLNTLPAVGLSLQGPLFEEPLPSGFLIEFGKATRLGSVHSQIQREAGGFGPEAQVPPLKSSCLPSWQPSASSYEVLGHEEGTDCEAVAWDLICAEYTLCNGFVTQSCCISEQLVGSSDPTVCDVEVAIMRDDTPEH